MLDDEELLGKEGTCSCGAPGHWCYNPYCEEIYGQLVLDCLCDICYNQLCDDI